MKSLGDAGETYRLIVTRRDASEVLLLPNGSGWTIPRVEVHPQERLAEQLTAELKRTWKLEGYCLFVPRIRTSDATGDESCALMESVGHPNESQLGIYWMSRSVATSCCDSVEASVIRESLAQLDSYSKDQSAGQFARQGWLQELLLWTQEQIALLGLSLTGGFRQFNAGPTFSLVRLELSDGAVWFKATGEPNSHELPVTVALARLFPPYVPRILGVHHSWNGWLSAEVMGASLDQITEFSAWERAAVQLAELQIASIEKTAELLEAQAKDLRVPKLAESIELFMTRMNELMSIQERPTPAPLLQSEVATLTAGLKDACALLESFGPPNSLGHIDFNPGNILLSGNGCVFLDWAEGCVTSPLLTFEYLRQHAARSGIGKLGAERLTGAYLRPWRPFYSPADLTRALTVAPLVAVFAYALASDSWRTVGQIRNPELDGYYRSLTRRMYRELLHVEERSELCLG